MPIRNDDETKFAASFLSSFSIDENTKVLYPIGAALQMMRTDLLKPVKLSRSANIIDRSKPVPIRIIFAIIIFLIFFILKLK